MCRSFVIANVHFKEEKYINGQFKYTAAVFCGLLFDEAYFMIVNYESKTREYFLINQFLSCRISDAYGVADIFWPINFIMRESLNIPA